MLPQLSRATRGVGFQPPLDNDTMTQETTGNNKPGKRTDVTFVLFSMTKILCSVL